VRVFEVHRGGHGIGRGAGFRHLHAPPAPGQHG
jgi:hypothetical protein